MMNTTDMMTTKVGSLLQSHTRVVYPSPLIY